MTPANCACVFFGAAFAAAGMLFACGKLHVRLSAWKQMPEEERRKIRVHPLCRNIGLVILLNGLIFLSKGLFDSFSNGWFTIAMVIWVAIASFDAWYISSSQRYTIK